MDNKSLRNSKSGREQKDNRRCTFSAMNTEKWEQMWLQGKIGKRGQNR